MHVFRCIQTNTIRRALAGSMLVRALFFTPVLSRDGAPFTAWPKTYYTFLFIIKQYNNILHRFIAIIRSLDLKRIYTYIITHLKHSLQFFNSHF